MTDSLISSDNEILIPPANYDLTYSDHNLRPFRSIWSYIKSIKKRNLISFLCLIVLFLLLIISLTMILSKKQESFNTITSTIKNIQRKNTFNCTISFMNATWNKTGSIFVNQIGKCGSDDDQLCYPHDLFIDTIHENLYVVDTNNNRIQKYSLNQTFSEYQSVIGMTVVSQELIAPSSIFVDIFTEDMYILDYNRNDVNHYENPPIYRVHLWLKNATNGRILLSEEGEYAFQIYSHIVLDQYMNIYIETRFHIRQWLASTNYRQVITVAGSRETDGQSLDQLTDPRGLYIDNDLTMYIVDWNNHRIQKWLANAKQGITLVSNLDYAYGISQDCQGNLYYGDVYRQVIYQFNQETNQTRIVIDNNGTIKSVFNPYGMKFDQFGNMFVIDYANSQIKKFSIL